MELIIMTGNIGSGKSLISSKYAKNGYVVVNMDSITRMIGGGEYGLYDSAKKDIYHSAEKSIIYSALDRGFSVVIDRTNMDKKRRSAYIDLGKSFNADIISYDFGPGTVEGYQRRIQSPYGIPADQWSEVFDFMEKSYEKPSIEEGFNEIIIPPARFKIHAIDFDGTIVENEFPNIGPLAKNDIVPMMHGLWKDFSNIIIIWTCRTGPYENEARQFLIKNKIPFDFINENPLFEMGGRKIFAHEYYDNRNRLFELK